MKVERRLADDLRASSGGELCIWSSLTSVTSHLLHGRAFVATAVAPLSGNPTLCIEPRRTGGDCLETTGEFCLSCLLCQDVAFCFVLGIVPQSAGLVLALTFDTIFIFIFISFILFYYHYDFV